MLVLVLILAAVRAARKAPRGPRVGEPGKPPGRAHTVVQSDGWLDPVPARVKPLCLRVFGVAVNGVPFGPGCRGVLAWQTGRAAGSMQRCQARWR